MNYFKSLLIPNLYMKLLSDVDFVDLYNRGIRMVLFDIDNTLTVHGSKECDKYAREQISRARQAGMNCFLLSNAREARAKNYSESLGVVAIPRARKPSTKGIIAAMKMKPGIVESQIAIIGDQLLTDILAGNRAKVFTILLDTISKKESIFLQIKRPVEGILKYMFGINRKDC